MLRQELDLAEVQELLIHSEVRVVIGNVTRFQRYDKNITIGNAQSSWPARFYQLTTDEREADL